MAMLRFGACSSSTEPWGSKGFLPAIEVRLANGFDPPFVIASLLLEDRSATETGAEIEFGQLMDLSRERMRLRCEHSGMTKRRNARGTGNALASHRSFEQFIKINGEHRARRPRLPRAVLLPCAVFTPP